MSAVDTTCLREVAPQGKQLDNSLLPKQLVHAKFKDPSGESDSGRVSPEEMVEFRHNVGSVFNVLLPEQLEYTARGDQLLPPPGIARLGLNSDDEAGEMVRHRISEDVQQAVRYHFPDFFEEAVLVGGRDTRVMRQASEGRAKLLVQVPDLTFCKLDRKERATGERVSTLGRGGLDPRTLE